jgi:hypothetical protein
MFGPKNYIFGNQPIKFAVVGKKPDQQGFQNCNKRSLKKVLEVLAIKSFFYYNLFYKMM